MFLSICLAILNLELFESIFFALKLVYYKDHHHQHLLVLNIVIILWYILLYCYISLYICSISGIGSTFYVNPFYHLRKWLKLVLTVVYTVIYSYLVILLLYISLYTLSYYRNFVDPPVYFVDYPVNSDASEWIAGHISLVNTHRTYYTYMQLKPLTDTAMQLYGYATVCMLLYSVEYYRYIVNI